MINRVLSICYAQCLFFFHLQTGTTSLSISLKHLTPIRPHQYKVWVTLEAHVCERYTNMKKCEQIQCYLYPAEICDTNPNEEAPLKHYCFGHRSGIFTRSDRDKSALDWKLSVAPLVVKVRQSQILCPFKEQMYTLWIFFISQRSEHVLHYFLSVKYSHSYEILFKKVTYLQNAKKPVFCSWQIILALADVEADACPHCYPERIKKIKNKNSEVGATWKIR